MQAKQTKKYFFFSLISHALLLLVFIISFNFSQPLPVLENTNKNDVISAVVLGDSPKNKILPQKINAARLKQEKKKLQEMFARKARMEAELQKDIIALKIAEKKKLEQQKALEAKKKRDKLAKDLLADIQKLNKKEKKLKQKQLQEQFNKFLQDHAEESLRKNLLNEDIKLQGIETREAQGEINKYKALILQAISEHWIVPTQANKRLFCELMIRVAASGLVIDVQVTKTSGDPALDSSARAAVLKASPLPVPSDPAAFAAFKQFVLKVKPENIVSSNAG